MTVTRLRDAVTLIVDKSSALEQQLLRNPGGKMSALEMIGGVQPPSPPPPSVSTNASMPKTAPDRGLEPDSGGSIPWEIGI